MNDEVLAGRIWRSSFINHRSAFSLVGAFRRLVLAHLAPWRFKSPHGRGGFVPSWFAAKTALFAHALGEIIGLRLS